MAIETSLTLVPDFSKATKAITDFSNKAESGIETVQKSFGALKAVAVAAVGVLASKALFNAIGSVVEAAAESEAAVNQLNSALKLSGDFSKEASEDLQAFAGNLQNTTTVGEETALEMLSLAKAFGVSNDEAKQLVTAAADLSQATGKDLESSLKLLGGTLSGNAGQLEKLIPSVKELTKEELAAGAAIDIVAERFSGAAADALNTFSGQVTRSKAIFGELSEELGAAIVQNPLVIATIEALTDGFALLADFLKANRKNITEFVTGFLENLLDIIPPSIGLVAKLVKAFGEIVKVIGLATAGLVLFVKALLELEASKAFVNGLADAFKFLSVGAIEGLKLIIETLGKIPGVGALVKETLGASIDDGIVKLQEIQDELINTTGQDVASGVVEGLDKIAIATFEVTQGAEDVFAKFNVGLIDAEKSAKKAVDNIKERAKQAAEEQDFATGPEAEQSYFDVMYKALEDAFSNVPGLVKGGLEVLNLVLKGGKGAGEALQKSAGLIAEQLLPGIGSTVESITGVLLQGPEAVKGFVDGFVQALPGLIDALAAAVPAVILALIDNLDLIIQALIIAVPRVIGKLVEEAPAIIVALIKEIPEVIASLVAGIAKQTFKLDFLVEGIGDFFAGLAQALVDAIGQLGKFVLEGITGILPAIFAKIKELFTGPVKGVVEGAKSFAQDPVGGIVKGAKKIGSFLGLAEGGVIPPGFPNDNFPARLTSGELVVPKDLTSRLENFIERNEQPQQVQQTQQQGPIVIQLSIGEKQLADVLLDLNRGGFRTA